MIDYVRSCIRAIGRGLMDGTSREATGYAGTSAEVGLHRAASDAVRIILYGHRR